MTVMASNDSHKRLFVGNLFHEVTDPDLKKLFGKYGDVRGVEVKYKKDIDGKTLSTFAFLDVNMTDSNVQQCIKEFNGLRWKKHAMKVQVAQESFMQRLRRERQERVDNFSGQSSQSNSAAATDFAPKPDQGAQEERAPRNWRARNGESSRQRDPQEDGKMERRQERAKRFDNSRQSEPSSSSYDPMSLMKGQIGRMNGMNTSKKLDSDEEPSLLPRNENRDENSFGGRKPLGDQESLFHKAENENIDESLPGVGKLQNGLVSFNDEEDEDKSLRSRPNNVARNHKRVYHSSSDDDDEPNVPLVPKVRGGGAEKRAKTDQPKPSTSTDLAAIESRIQKSFSRPAAKAAEPKQKDKKAAPVQRRRYYSSSDDDDEGESSSVRKAAPKLGGGFSSTFWQDSDEENDGTSTAVASLRKLQNHDRSDAAIDANARRLESQKRRREEQNRERSRLKNALNGVDGAANGRMNKKTRFEENNPEIKQTEAEKKGASLFDSDDSDEEDGSDFKVRRQFEGKSGEKLLALQSKISATDDRFKIDQRFKESDDEDEETRKNEEHDDLDVEAEKQRNLDILKSITGISSDAKPKHEAEDNQKLMFKDASLLRFDPDNQDHAKFQKREASEDESDIEEAKGNFSKPSKETPMPETSTDRSYFLKKDIFSKPQDGEKKASTGFSFGFGGSSSSAPANGGGFSVLKKYGGEQEEYKTTALSSDRSKKMGFLEKNPFKYDSSDEDDDDEQEGGKGKSKVSIEPFRMADTQAADFGRKLAEKSSVAKLTEPFFFGREDKRFAEGAEWLSQATENTEEARSKYDQKRPLLASIMKKKKLKSKAKQQDKKSFGTKAKAPWKRGRKRMAVTRRK